MKVLILLAICALAHTANVPIDVTGDAIERHLGHYELQMAASPRKVQDYVVEEFNSLDVFERNMIADVIQGMLEDLRDVVINGNGELPPLDPYTVDHLGPFEIATSGVNGVANINNLRMEGLMWYLVDKVTFNSIRLTLGVQITVPRLTITGSYDAKARIALINHEAGGNFRVFVNRLIVGTDIKMGASLSGGYLYLRELTIHLDIHDTFINIEGMTGSALINAFINSQIQSITQETIQNELDNVSKELAVILFDTIDAIIREL